MVRPLISDFIEIGVDILNPVQYNLPDMDAISLKKEFSNDLVFWGGGVDTQSILSLKNPEIVRDEVRRQIERLGERGGFVFATVHNIQNDVPVENLNAMWETIIQYGTY